MRETANLRFVFHRDDAGRLEPLFPALQALYTQLLADFRLTPLPGKRELQIALSVRPAEPVFANASRRYDLSAMATTSDIRQLQRELGRQLTGKVLQQFYDRAGDMGFVLDGIREWEVMTWMGEPDPESETHVVQVLREKGFVPLLAVEPAHFDTPALNALTATVIDYLVQHHGRDMVRRLIDGVQRYHRWPALIRSSLLPYLRVAEGSHDLAWWRFVAQRYRLPPPQDRSRDEVLANLRWMLQLENQAVETRDRELFQTLLDPEISSRWQSNRLDLVLKGHRSEPVLKPADIRDWGYRDDGAWVVVSLTPDSPDFRLFSTTLRFFRFADQRWYLTSAEVVFSGPPLRLRTERLEFRYREPDAPLIKSLTPNDVDALYRRTVQDLGINLKPGKRMAITFVYEPDLAPSFFSGGPDEVLIPAPRLFEDLQTFRFFLGFTIANGLMTEIIAREPQAMGLLMNGITMWEAEQWGVFPFWEVGKQAEIQRRLRESNFPSLSHRYPEVPELTTLVEYIAATYGRQRLVDLVQAIDEHPDLQNLIPAVLDVDVGTFEAGWRAYLERTYGP